MATIDDMDIPNDWKLRWCEAEICGCLGCINRVPKSQMEANRVFGRQINKDEWSKWINSLKNK